MHRTITGFHRWGRWLLGGALALALGGVAAEEAERFTGAEPLDPQPAAGEIRPGLAVTYYYAMFQDVNDITLLVKGKPGPPIEMLDHDTDTGRVLTANRSMGVGAEIRGMIRFDAAGTYRLRVNSNDGVRLTIAGIQLWEDPYIHPDTLSPPLDLVVDQPGWYDLAIDYYQKKGTSALGLYWTPPGAGEEKAVPKEAYGHLE